MKETINGQERRKEILQFIEKYIEDHNYPPSVREITVASSLKSSATTFHHLQKMKEEGIIESDTSDGDAKSSSRAIRIPGWKMKKDGSDSQWIKFSDAIPKKPGWYQCTICFPFLDDEYTTYVMDLFWNNISQRFVDNRVQHVFDTYDVYGYSKNNGTDKMYTCSLCDRTDEVVAWRKLPDPCLIEGIKYYEKRVHDD